MAAATFVSLVLGCVSPTLGGTGGDDDDDDDPPASGCVAPGWVDAEVDDGSAGEWSRLGKIDSNVSSCAVNLPGDGRALAVSSSTFAVDDDGDWDDESFYGQQGIVGAFLDVAGGEGNDAWFTFNDFDDDLVRAVHWDGQDFTHLPVAEVDFGTDPRVVVTDDGEVHGFGVGDERLYHFWLDSNEIAAERVDNEALGAVAAATHDGTLYAAYPIGGLVALAEGRTDEWEVDYVAEGDWPSTSAAGLSLAVDACGTPVVAWPGARGESFLAARDGDAWVVGTLDDDNDGTRPAVTVTVSGEIVAVFPGIDGNSRVYRNRGGGWTRAPLDDFAQPGDHACVDLAASADGRLVAAVYTTASGLTVYEAD